MTHRLPGATTLLLVLVVATLVVMPAGTTIGAGQPHGAYYSSDNTSLFWFLHVSDLHVGTSGSTDATRLQWLVTTARSVINPQFIVATGDLTDSTNGNWLGWPDGPYQAEWDEYKAILSAASAGPDFFYDLPGNHDAYNDAPFAFYRANSVQGRATGGTQVSWTRVFPFGTYHFLGVNTAGNDGASFSLVRPWGDNAGLDTSELAFINASLAANTTADLTMVFGHHPVTNTGSSDDTWLFYGHQPFIQALDLNGASAYGYGHTHDVSQTVFAGDAYTGNMTGDGVHYTNVASLGKSSGGYFTLVAVDCNGVSSVTPANATWPVVLITAPVDRLVGSTVNPYAYTVPASATNPIRALVFDSGTIARVEYRVDGSATWWPMSRVAANPALWEAVWNASALAAGIHALEVRAIGTTTVSDSISVEVTGAANRPPVALADSYTVQGGSTLSVGAPGVLANDTDADGQPLTAALASQAFHGVATLGATGAFTYVPTTGYTGIDSFSYTASDGIASSAPAAVSITVTAPPQTDTVTVQTATWSAKTKRLTVTATSSAQPTAVLTVTGYGTMTWKAKTGRYTLVVTTPAHPGSVTVSSNLGGTATRTVSTVK